MYVFPYNKRYNGSFFETLGKPKYDPVVMAKLQIILCHLFKLVVKEGVKSFLKIKYVLIPFK